MRESVGLGSTLARMHTFGVYNIIDEVSIHGAELLKGESIDHNLRQTREQRAILINQSGYLGDF